MVVYGNFILIGGMTGVHIFSISEPASPSKTSYTAMGAWVNDIVVYDSVVYMAKLRRVFSAVLTSEGTLESMDVAQLPARVLALGVNKERRNLMVATKTMLYRFFLGSAPYLQASSASVSINVGDLEDMRVQGAWTYINGDTAKAYHDMGADGLAYGGTHDLRDWVDGRLLEDGQSEYVNLDGNQFEVWRD